MKLDWKDAGPDGWSSKPYQTARRGKLSFRLSPRTRNKSRASIDICHDEFEYGRDKDAKTREAIVFETMTSTSSARDYAESFDYRAWRTREIAGCEASVELARQNLARCTQSLKDLEKLPLDA